MESHAAENYPLPTVLRDATDPAIDASNLADLKTEIRKVSALLLKGGDKHLEFLEDFLNRVYSMYESPVQYDSNEDAFNQLYTWTYLHVIGASVNIGGCKGYFIQGQPILTSTTQQLTETGI